MIILVNYADKKYKKAQYWNSVSGKKIAKFDVCYSYSPDDVDQEYRQNHKDIFDYKRGNGLWLWKPYIINKVLQESKEGDYIFYCDSGAFFIRNIKDLIKTFKDDEYIWVSDCPLMESCFTKEICFKIMDCDKQQIGFTNQIQATYLILRNCSQSKAFVHEWLQYCENIELMKPEGGLSSIRENLGMGFVAHREDQSVLSLLCKKKGIIAHRDPSHRGVFPETFYNEKYAYKVPDHKDDKYKSILFLHKLPNPNIINCSKIMLIAIYSKIVFRLNHNTGVERKDTIVR